MAATVNIMRLTGTNDAAGGSPTYTSITSASSRLSSADDPSPGATNPIPVPTSGSNYSFWATTQLYAASGADNSLTNIKWYSDGTNTFGTGTNGIVSTASSYASATGTTGSSGDLLDTTNHPGLVGSTSDMFLYTSSCKLAVAGSITTGTGSFGDRVIFQVRVDTTGSAGNSGEETLTWEFDET